MKPDEIVAIMGRNGTGAAARAESPIGLALDIADRVLADLELVVTARCDLREFRKA